MPGRVCYPPDGGSYDAGVFERMSEHDLTGAREAAPESPAQERFAWYGDRILLLTVPAVFLLDQGTKYLAKNLLSYGQSWPEDSPFRFTHVTNSGTAFGLFQSATPLLIVASIVAIGFLVYFYRTHGAPLPLLRFAIGLQLGGAFGNLTDRLINGAVVDFIGLAWWPVFNLADSSIVVGITILVAYLVLSDRFSGRPSQLEPDEAAGDDR